MASVTGEREIDLSKLSIEQLNQLKTQLSEELEEIGRHFTTLKDAQARLNSCRSTVMELGPASNGTELLVPLTQSLYVPGTLSDADTLLLDIGTGYFVEKTPTQTKEYIDKRLAVITQNLDSVQQVLAQKEGSLRMVSSYFQRKIMVISQTQAAQRQQAMAAAGKK